MEKMKFQTNIKCGGCVAQVSPLLNNKKGVEKWEVDLNSPDRILTVNSDTVTEEVLIRDIEALGFKIERMVE
jgi:copper chaperone